jgi:hypothetical protein
MLGAGLNTKVDQYTIIPGENSMKRRDFIKATGIGVAGAADQTIALEFKAPENAAELHNEGCHMRLRFKLAAGSTVMLMRPPPAG